MTRSTQSCRCRRQGWHHEEPHGAQREPDEIRRGLDRGRLDEFLTNPSAKVPGTAMIGILNDPQQRADVIAYLATLKE